MYSAVAAAPPKPKKPASTAAPAPAPSASLPTGAAELLAVYESAAQRVAQLLEQFPTPVSPPVKRAMLSCKTLLGTLSHMREALPPPPAPPAPTPEEAWVLALRCAAESADVREFLLQYTQPLGLLNNEGWRVYFERCSGADAWANITASLMETAKTVTPYRKPTPPPPSSASAVPTLSDAELRMIGERVFTVLVEAYRAVIYAVLDNEEDLDYVTDAKLCMVYVRECLHDMGHHPPAGLTEADRERVRNLALLTEVDRKRSKATHGFAMLDRKDVARRLEICQGLLEAALLFYSFAARGEEAFRPFRENAHRAVEIVELGREEKRLKELQLGTVEGGGAGAGAGRGASQRGPRSQRNAEVAAAVAAAAGPAPVPAGATPIVTPGALPPYQPRSGETLVFHMKPGRVVWWDPHKGPGQGYIQYDTVSKAYFRANHVARPEDIPKLTSNALVTFTGVATTDSVARGTLEARQVVLVGAVPGSSAIGAPPTARPAGRGRGREH